MATNDKWAFITGASSGIGKALAHAFGAQGYHLFLTARNREALEQVAVDCAEKYGVRTQTHLADLAHPDAVDGLIGVLCAAQLPFGVLVNNAGFGVKGDFLGTGLELELSMVTVQLDAMLKLTKALVPGMVARKQGRILNVASVYSFAPVPYQSVYGACKAFVWSFSAGLREELRGTGVTVTVLCPGVTQTEFRARAGISEKNKSAGVTAESVAEIAVRATLKGQLLVVPGFFNKLFVFLARRLPVPLVLWCVLLINKTRGMHD